jgi:long-chain acyl-CoA synthetase
VSESTDPARPWLGAYPPGVPADPEFPVVPLHQLLDDAADGFGSAPALTFLGATLSYREVRSMTGQLSGSLQRLGVEPGDRVALVLPNSPQFVIAFYAVSRAGAIAVPLNPLSTEVELARQLDDCGARLVICLDKTFATLDALRTAGVVDDIVVTSVMDFAPSAMRTWLRVPLARNRRRLAALTETLPAGSRHIAFTDLLRGSDTGPAHAVEPTRDVAVLLHTGGTTGVSRPAMLTHFNLVANAHQIRLWYADAVPGREVTIAALPLSHAYGLTLCLTTNTLLAGRLVLLPRWNLDEALQAIDSYRPTLFPGVPPIYEALASSPKSQAHDLGSIRICVSGAMRLAPETQDRFERLTGARLVEGYGMTETSPVTHANPVVGARRPGTIGVPLPGTQCRLVDPNHPDREVEPGDPGELVVAGPQVFSGYWGSPADPDLFTADGYYRTGDVACMDDDGFFRVVDRRKELIIAGGFNVYPAEVEGVLRAHPAVADACVIGVPDRYRGETVRAYVVLHPDAKAAADELIEHCSQSLTAYKVPRDIDFRDDLPRTEMGKIRRQHLRDEAIAASALTEGS